MEKDYYKVLGVSKDATKEEIKKAYRKLAHKYHPDKKGGDEARFKEVNEAYQILSDDAKKSQYDRFGRVGDGGFDFTQAGYDFDLGDLGDIFGSTIFEEMFGGRGSRTRDVKRGEDIEVSLEMSLEDVLVKQEKKIKLNKFATCQRCDGEGAEPGTKKNECVTCRGKGVVQEVKRTVFGSFTKEAICPDCSGEGQKPDKPCNVCRGEGRIKKEEEITINVPAGVDSNQIMKLAGKGGAGRIKGRAGDLYVRILIKKHPIFTRKGDDLFTTVKIPYSDAVTGGEVSLKDIEGKKMIVKIPTGTFSGKVIRISGKGITKFSGFGRGDLFLKMDIAIPDKLTKRQKELLQEIKKEGL